jgi:hypothetical protein
MQGMIQQLLLRVRGAITSLWGPVLLALVVRLAVVLLTTGATFDINSYHIQAQSVLEHRNVYTVTDRYPYPPVWIWLVALAQWLANTTAIPFVWLVKLPAVLGDCLTVALLRWRRGSAAALFYALNPVSILITAGHGQFDGLVMALVVAAWALWDGRQRAGLSWAVLALGGAIALKVYPVLLLPAMLVKAPAHRERVVLTALAAAPLLVSMLVYGALFGLEPAMVTHVLGYSSYPYFGWSPYVDVLLHNLWPAGFTTASLWLSILGHVVTLLVPVLLVFYCPRWPLERLWLATFLGVYALAPGLAAQYLLWAVPLLALVPSKRAMLYSILALLAILLYYLSLYFGAVPWGPALASLAPANTWLGYYLLANLAWWLFCLWLWRATLREQVDTSVLNNRYIVGKTPQTTLARSALMIGAASKESDRRESYHRSRAASVSLPETLETQGESQPDSDSDRFG